MNYTIKAIPTTYRGVRFRSRLEARWAAMFDKLGWHWRYEPLDLDGWIPDFIVNDVLPVEVKPYLWANSDDPTSVVEPEVVAKIKGQFGIVVGADFRCGKNLGCTNDLFPMGVLVGSRWFSAEYTCWADALDRAVVGDSWRPRDTTYSGKTRVRYDICEDTNSWETRFNGLDKGPGAMRELPPSLFEAWWTEAGNAVQYRRTSHA